MRKFEFTLLTLVFILSSTVIYYQTKSPSVSDGGISVVTTGDGDVTVSVNTPAQQEPQVMAVESEIVIPEVVEPETVGPEPEPESLRSILEGEVKEDEGFSDVPYMLYGIPHICWGHQIVDQEEIESLMEDGKMSEENCQRILDSDLDSAEKIAEDYVGSSVWPKLPVAKQSVVSELAYVLGKMGLQGFTELEKAILVGDWAWAGDEIQNSLLPNDVGQRRVNQWKERLL